ncbi:unnamed protein product [Dicrocoelium dendriticum]|nr:unnamed protein product [Dicrocoelium dendriticum]
MEICASGGVNALRHAVNMGGNLNIVDCMGRTVVHEAARNGQLHVLVALSGFGIPFDVYDEELSNPIHLAAAKDEKCCKFLAQRGCRVKVKNKFGQTPRMIAVAQDQKACLKVLRRLDRNEANTPKRAEPWALRLYDWCTTYTAVLRERFTQLGEYLAVEAQRASRMQADVAKGNAEQEEGSQPAVESSGLQGGNQSVERGRRSRSKRDGSVRSSNSTVKPVVRLPAVEFESVLQSLSAPYDDTILHTLVSLHQRDADNCIDWREFLSGTKYVNKAYRMAAYEKGVKKSKAKKGTNVYQAALAWADPRVIEHVQEKWELAQEKLKQQKKSGKTRGKQSFAARSKSKAKPLAPVWPVPAIAIRRSRSLYRVATRGSSNNHPPNATAPPKNTSTYSKFPWLTLPTRAEQLVKLAEARERYGWDHDLPGVSLRPFDRRLSERLKEAQTAE